MRTCRMWNNDHGACPTFEITVSNALSHKSFYLLVSNNHAMFDLKNAIAANLGAKYSSDIQIMFQSQLVGDDGSEKRVIDFGLGDGSVLEVVRQVQYVELDVVVDYYVEAHHWPLSKAEFSFPLHVSRNLPCAAQIKAELMEICEEEFASELLGMQK